MHPDIETRIRIGCANRQVAKDFAILFPFQGKYVDTFPCVGERASGVTMEMVGEESVNG